MNRRLHTVADPFKPSLEYSLQNVFPPPELSIHAPRPSVHHEPILPPSSPRRDASVESPPSFGLTQDPLAPIQVPVEDSTLTQPVHAHCRYESQCSTMPGLTRSLSPGGRREAPNEFRPERTDSGQEWTVNGSHIPTNPEISDAGVLERAETIGLVYHSGTTPDSESVSSSKRFKPLQERIKGSYIIAFLVDTLPRQIYLILLLRLPKLYHSRLSRVFYEADVSLKELQEGILQTPPTHQYEVFEMGWQSFVNSVLQEWGVFCVISGVLLLITLATLSLPGAANDPLTRYIALVSMIFTFMSLVYGCIYIVGFAGMRETYRGVEWVTIWKKSHFFCAIFWNDWVFLAMPAVFLAWSLILYGVCIMSFVWRAGTIEDSVRYSLAQCPALIPRIIASLILGIGIIYLFFIARTFERYGAIKVQSMKQINNVHRPLHSPTIIDAVRPTEAPQAPTSPLKSLGDDTE